MKNFQQNLFISIALVLCGLCAWQWYVQTVLRNHIDALDQSIFRQSTEIQGYTNSIKTMDGEVAELQTRIAELKKEGVTNRQLVLDQKRDLLRLRVTAESLSNEIVQYREATNVLESKLSGAYDGIKKQNDAIAQLAAQRDEFIGKYTNSIKDRNDLVEKYNALVDRMKKMQDAAAGGAK
jgi:peptidoglycan hydrolase CwlO-like protein